MGLKWCSDWCARAWWREVCILHSLTQVNQMKASVVHITPVLGQGELRSAIIGTQATTKGLWIA
jgi:hypothetical protein